MEKMMSEIQLSVKGLKKTFDSDILKAKQEVLRGVDLEVGGAQIYGFLGPNGAGKTTTIKSITGLITPDAGKMEICGLPHNSLQARKLLGFMPELPGFYDHLTGRELLKFYIDLLGDTASSSRNIDKLLEEVGIAKHADRKIRKYSKGMVQRIALAQALVNDPQLIILDEPMSGLDPIGRRDFRQVMMNLKEQGKTIFFSSHILPDVESLCDRVAILINGQVRAEGGIDEIVSLDTMQFEITFNGTTLQKLSVAMESSYEGSDACWIRVAADKKNEAMQAITTAGGEILSINPVRKTLEEVLMSSFDQEVAQ
jgi:ABC-2 type transport system ATP-binding protein